MRQSQDSAYSGTPGACSASPAYRCHGIVFKGAYSQLRCVGYILLVALLSFLVVLNFVDLIIVHCERPGRVCTRLASGMLRRCRYVMNTLRLQRSLTKVPVIVFRAGMVACCAVALDVRCDRSNTVLRKLRDRGLSKKSHFEEA